MVAFLQVAHLKSYVKHVTYSMIKSSNKKHFKKDIHILKIQGNGKYCNHHGN